MAMKPAVVRVSAYLQVALSVTALPIAVGAAVVISPFDLMTAAFVAFGGLVIATCTAAVLIPFIGLIVSRCWFWGD